MKKLKVGSDCSGVGALDQALLRLGVDYEKSHVCDFNKYARRTYILNYGTDEDFKLLDNPDVKFIDSIYDREFGTSKIKPTKEEWLKVDEIHEQTARLFSFYYPWDMYKREIPSEPVDLYAATVPCQAFSLAGKRKGEDDKRGVLFYNSHEFIKKNKPKAFIFENVKGLISDNGGKTFQRWIDLLGGKSVNGNPVIFPHEESVPYNVYCKVLNAKHYGVPQNRERIFIIGIREDKEFNFPKPFELIKILKDVLEEYVDEKYFLSDKMIEGFINKKTPGFEKRFKPLKIESKIANCVTTKGCSAISDNFIQIGYINQDTQASKVYSQDGTGQTLCAGTHGYANGYIMVKSANSKGYEIAEIGEDSINFEHPNSGTRRGRVGKGIAQTLTTSCNQGIAEPCIIGYTRDSKGKVVSRHEKYISGTIHTSSGGGGNTDQFVKQSDFKIRKLTPRECFRLMDFDDTFKFDVSDSQAYKQAGNSICVEPLKLLIENILKLLL